MAISIEEALLAKAQQDQQNQMGTFPATALGMGAGALLGAAGGEVPHQGGLLINKLKDRLAEGQGLVPVTKTGMQNVRASIKPGPRFAGGLVGAILGGALGAGIRSEAIQDNPAAMLLAKLQTQGSLTAYETQQLQSVLADTYSNITGAA
jgi:hypothetical protein